MPHPYTAAVKFGKEKLTTKLLLTPSHQISPPAVQRVTPKGQKPQNSAQSNLYTGICPVGILPVNKT